MFDNFFDSAMDHSTDGDFPAVVLSGFRTNTNNGTGHDPLDGRLITDGDATYLEVVVFPLTDFGLAYGDPRLFKTTDEVNTILRAHAQAHRGRTEYPVDKKKLSLQFGQQVTCYFENGSIRSSDFRGLRIKKPIGTAEINLSFLNIYGADKLTGPIKAFGDGAPNLLGSYNPSGIDPRFPPWKKEYIGSFPRYRGTYLECGNFPQDLLARGTAGGKIKPVLMKEIINSYNQMAIAFRAAFPNKQLVGSGYRPYADQLRLYNDPTMVNAEGRRLAAKPGTSFHGYGLAVDCSYFTDGQGRRRLAYSGAEYKWMAENSKQFGFINPYWARQGGSKPEPWHWEWINKNKVFKGMKKTT